MSDDFGERYYVSQVDFPVLPNDQEQSAEKPNNEGPDPERWSPTFADVVTVFALVVAVVMWLAPPDWEVGLPVVIATILLVIFTALRHRSHVFVRGAIGLGVIAVLCFVAWKPIWTSFKKEHPAPAALDSLPSAAPKSATPQDQSTPAPSFRSTSKRMSFVCHRPRSIWERLKLWTRLSHPLDQAELQRRADITGAQVGARLEVDMFPDGFRIKITPDPSAGLMIIVERAAVEVRRIDDDLYVTETADFVGIFDVLGLGPITDPKAARESAVFIEKLLNVETGACRML